MIVKGAPSDKQWYITAGIILSLGPANQRQYYIVTPCLIDLAHTHSDPCFVYGIVSIGLICQEYSVLLTGSV